MPSGVQRPEADLLQEIVDELKKLSVGSYVITLNYSGIPSDPPEGCYKVTNIYVNQEGKLVVEWDNET